MYLKHIELLGFKSFPTKTKVKFADGVTAIVGPNGCGKTNILDALRWVLGEQKPTLLRGGKMEEVIFNGTRDLKPLGMAEVSLTIVNNNGVLPTEYHELQITRRLFRSGESEYLINKVPCRLKDITDLFVDTGLGAHSYSVIQQHMIDSVISDKAEERRFLFEEAAGITKYKQRRKAAMRKLDATENDFLRLRDIYAEVKTRVNSLYRQHKKAERFSKLTEQIKGWEIFLGASRIKQIQLEKRELKAEFDALSDQRSSRNSALDLTASQLEVDRKELLDLEHAAAEIGVQISSITEEAHQLERESSVLNEKKANARQLIERNQIDIQNFDTRSAELTTELDTATGQEQTQDAEAQKLTGELEGARDVQATNDQALLSARAARETGSSRLLDLEGRLSSGKAEESSLREQTEDMAGTAGQIDEALASIEPKQSELIQQVESQRSELGNLTTRRSELETRRTELTAEIEQAIDQGEEYALELSDVKASMEACQARRNLLEDMMTHYEGYESGVVEAMEAKDRWSTLAGTVADIFVPVAGMEGVLQAALGEMSKFLVCHDRHEAEQIIAYLKTEGKGRVGILVPRLGSIAPAMKRPELDIPGVVGWLDNYVSTDDTLKPLKEAILSRTVVFEPDADVDAILERLPFGFGAVSTTGVLYSKNMISGGSDDDFPLFRRQELVDEQARLIEDFQQQTTRLQEKRNQTTATLGGLRAEADQVASQLEEILETIEAHQRQLAETEFDSRSLSTEFDRLTAEKRNLVGRLESVRNRQYSLGLDSSELATQKESLVDEIQQAANHLGQLEENASRAAAEVSRLQVAAIEARSRVDHTQHQIRHLNELLNGIGQGRVSKTSEMEQANKDIEQAETRLQTLQSDLKVAFERRDLQTEQQDGMRSQQAELMDRTNDKETQVKALRHEKDTTSEKLHQTDIRLTAIGSEITSLGERFQAEYEVNIAEVTATRPEEDIADEAALELVASLKDKLRTFGAVNLLALEEYDVANEREKFLNAQLADLTTAKADLKSTIQKINKTARQLFNETFEKVQGHFSTLFVDLFAGGEARISLVDPDDPLESDIEIIARPGGKKLLAITMLSGGERALTAISLLFSLYLVKPSPFCILDEIDAPLDDANCQRFLKIIRNFSNQTQFICITHNKITMEASNNLYGITMERPGVSKLVAVKFTAGKDGGEEELVEVAPEEGEEIAVDETAAVEPVTVEPVEPVEPNERVAIESEELAQPVELVETDDAELPESIQDRLTPLVPTNPDSDA